MSRATRLEQRLAAIVDADCERRPLSAWRVAALMTLAGVVVVGIGAAQRQMVEAAPPRNHEIAFAQEPAQESGQPTKESAAPSKSNVSITNGDFEGALQPIGDPQGWHATRVRHTAPFTKFAREESGHAGQHSVSIQIDQTHPQETVSYNWLTDLTGWKPEQALQISGWVKTENVSVSPQLLMMCWDKSSKPLAYASSFETHPVVGTKDWTRIETAIVVPQGTDRILLRAALLAPANRGGKVWFDDIAVAETTVEAARKTTVTPASSKKPATPDAAKPEAAQSPAPAAEKTPSLEAVLQRIEQHSAVAIDKSVLNDAAIRGVLESLKDPYSTLITAEQLKSLNQQIEGQLVGIGAALAKEEIGIVVTAVMPNSPALRGGLKPRDVIVEVNGQPANDLAESVMRIRGAAGTEVTLKIRRPDKQESQLTLKRGEIRVPSVKGLTIDEQGQWRHWLDTDQKIAFVQIAAFDKGTPAELKDVLTRLHEQGAKGLVLDLRGNPGGLLPACVEVAQLFLKAGTIVQVRGRTPEQNWTYSAGAANASPFAELPLVVLIDPTTASAAEILAGALKDNHRAVLVGERTFGKGSVQAIFPLGEGGSALKLTTAQMFSPSGQPLHRSPDAKSWGVDPQDGFFVPQTAEQRAARQKAALDRVTGQLKLPQPITADFAEKELADSALAAALKTISAKLKTGEFTKTGRPVAELQARLTEIDKLRKQLEELKKQQEEQRRKLEQEILDRTVVIP